MGHDDQAATDAPMTEEQKRTPGAWPGNAEGQPANSDGQPATTTSEPAYSGAQGQQQPSQDDERPDEAGHEDPRKTR